jgi:hypothetical protein
LRSAASSSRQARMRAAISSGVGMVIDSLMQERLKHERKGIVERTWNRRQMLRLRVGRAVSKLFGFPPCGFLLCSATG